MNTTTYEMFDVSTVRVEQPASISKKHAAVQPSMVALMVLASDSAADYDSQKGAKAASGFGQTECPDERPS